MAVAEIVLPAFLSKPPVPIDDVEYTVEDKIIHLVKGVRWKLRMINMELDPFKVRVKGEPVPASQIAKNQLLTSKSSGKKEWHRKDHCGKSWWENVFSIIFEDKLIAILLSLPYVVEAATEWSMSKGLEYEETVITTKRCPGLQNEDVTSNWLKMYFGYRRGKIARPSRRQDRPVFDNPRDFVNTCFFHASSPYSHWCPISTQTSYQLVIETLLGANQGGASRQFIQRPAPTPKLHW